MLVLFIMLLVMLPILLPAVKRQLKKPEFTDADMFVDFVSNDLFKDLDIAVPVQTHQKNSCDHNLRVMNPKAGFEFYVKCCYYKDAKKLDIVWCTEQQFRNCKALPGFLLLVVFGIGGPSHFPDNVYIVPLSQLTSNKTELLLLEKFRFHIGQDIDFSNF